MVTADLQQLAVHGVAHGCWVHNNVRSQRMSSILIKRVFEVPEAWFSAFLFPFKLFTVFAALGPLIWYLMLPPNTTGGGPIDEAYFTAVNDFRAIAMFVGLLYFLSALALVIGGLVQLFKYSRQAALWSIGFGILAFVIGRVLVGVCLSLPNKYEYLRSVA